MCSMPMRIRSTKCSNQYYSSNTISNTLYSMGPTLLSTVLSGRVQYRTLLYRFCK